MLITGEEISPQTASKMAKERDEKVEEFLNGLLRRESHISLSMRAITK